MIRLTATRAPRRTLRTWQRARLEAIDRELARLRADHTWVRGLLALVEKGPQAE